ncbi:TonB-dependent receptor [Aliikangiella marina]|uniref:TonB-dependent receptor n=1 Tax=Aliikangiella marina TaxID=1712262 RepID=A0A545TDU0_9GAMM|nr:TonB-dependent receptor [Aliikangiella marina]TQV75393.1 TonB-dependent receptor [Aliikangiella marina]
MNTLNRKLLMTTFACLYGTMHTLSSAAVEGKHDYFELSLEELAGIKVVTSSKREQTVEDSYANIMVITKEMIERRGYRNVIEVLEDLPGFDFATYEDGGGEYPVHFLNRGIGGDNGNTRLLIMVDGLVQNHISFNWSQGLTDEQMLFDVERIEVVQGPGSSLYGAQAVSGIVHIITKQKFKGSDIKLLLGENNTRSLEYMYGNTIGEINYQIALKTYLSDGDMGKGRPDPAGYFTGNVHPDFLTANYDENGVYGENVPNPIAGQPIPDGFKNSKDDQTLRFKVSKDDLRLGINYWKKKDGLGSYVTGYEYDATADDFITHHSSFTVYMNNKLDIVADEVLWKTNLWYRVDNQESDTGFRYNYRFNTLKKSYHGSSSQIGFENQVDWKLGGDKTLILGTRLLGNRQTEQVVSLGAIQNGNASTTNSSWDIAVTGVGLFREKVNEIFDENEFALYGLLEGSINEQLSYSIGTRYSRGSDYGWTNNPRAGLIYRPNDDWTIKTLYGSAFRQPSLFELRDEFRGSLELKPEEIETYEIEVTRKFKSIGTLKGNIFYSSLDDGISLVPDSSRAGGERYANVDSSKVRGLSLFANVQPLDNLSLYANYIFQEGNMDGGSWKELPNTAQSKLNIGANWQPLTPTFNVNMRVNYVGKRETPESNTYFNSKAPGYTKVDLVLTWAELFDKPGLSTQLTVNNIFDESYFGVGRQSGSSVAGEYDPATNPDPAGFIPAYHPQAGRTIYWNITYRM